MCALTLSPVTEDRTGTRRVKHSTRGQLTRFASASLRSPHRTTRIAVGSDAACAPALTERLTAIARRSPHWRRVWRRRSPACRIASSGLGKMHKSAEHEGFAGFASFAGFRTVKPQLEAPRSAQESSSLSAFRCLQGCLSRPARRTPAQLASGQRGN